MKLAYGEILRQTHKAVQYKFGDRNVWLPVSQIQKEDLAMGMVWIPDWLAEKNKLQEFKMR